MSNIGNTHLSGLMKRSRYLVVGSDGRPPCAHGMSVNHRISTVLYTRVNSKVFTEAGVTYSGSLFLDFQ